MQVYNKPTGTNRLTGFAAEVKTPVDKEEVEIKVEMPDQKISKTEKLNMTNGSFVGISFSGNVLEFKQQAKPFGYD